MSWMRSASNLAPLAFLLLAACQMAVAPARPNPPPLEIQLDPVMGLLPEVVVDGERPWRLEERMRHHGVPGVSIAVIDRFEVVWARAYGVADVDTQAPVTKDTLFQVSSTGQTVAAAMALRLVEDGRLSLDGDVNAALRSWKVPPSQVPGGTPVTLARLLSHSAGLSVPGSPGFEPGEPRPTLLATLDGLPPANTRPVRVEHEPGTFRSAGGGYMILQQLLEDLTGEPFAGLAQRMVLSPLDLRRSTFAQPLPPELASSAASGHGEDGKVLPGRWRVHVDLSAAGFWSTASEYARFVADLQRAAAGRPAKLLSPEMARRMLAPVTPQTGLGVALLPRRGVTYFGHGGANWGYNSMFVAHPQTGQGVVVLTNSDNGGPLCWEIVRSVASAYDWPGYLPEPRRRLALSERALDRLAGRYRLDADDVLTVERQGDRLRAISTLGKPFKLLPVEGDTFVRVDQSLEYRFSTDSPGTATLSTRWPDEEWGSGAAKIGANEKVPSERLEEGDVDGAIAALTELRARAADDPALERTRLEERARTLLKRGHLQAAAALLRFSIDLHPGFAATWDALAEAALALENREEARRASEEVLRALETDFSPTASWRVVYRRNAERRLGTPTP